MAGENKRISELGKAADPTTGTFVLHDAQTDLTQKSPIKEAIGGTLRTPTDWSGSPTSYTDEAGSGGEPLNYIVRHTNDIWYESLINPNVGNPPGQGVNWNQLTLSPADGVTITPYSAGLFTIVNSQVIDPVTGARYTLDALTPYQSTDLATEITADDWIAAPLAAQDSYDFTGSNPSHLEGRFYYDITKHNHVLLNDVIDVALDVGLEVWIRVYNDTGGTINNGQVCYISGVNGGNGLQEISLAQADSVTTSDVLGIATHDIEDASIGYIVAVGEVNDVPTTGFTLGVQTYLSATVAGDFVEVSPLPPDQIVPVCRILSVGASGKIFVRVGNIISPTTNTISSGFSSSGGVTGVDNYIASHYIFDAGGTPTGPGFDLGSAGEMHGSRAWIVLSGASTDMVIRVSGDSWDGQTETLADFEDLDTTGGVQDQYFETSKIFNGTVNFSLQSGGAVDINIGFVHYEGNDNTRYILTGVSWTGVAGANDAGPDFQVIPHSPTGWTYTVPGAIPPTPAIDVQNELTNGALVNGIPFTFQVTGHSDVIRGDQSEGLVVLVNYNSNNSILTSNILLSILN